MKIRQKFFRVDNASTLQLTSDVDLISINTTAAVILQLPIDLPAGKQIKIKSLVATPNVTVKSWNNSTLLTPTNEITIIEYTNQFVFTEIEEGGGGGESGWSANTTRTELNSNLGLSVSTFSGINDYISIIDASLVDITIDLSTLEGLFTFWLKKFKKIGSNKVILHSDLGFSDGTNDLEVDDFIFLVFDTYKWVIFNKDNSSLKIKSKKITGIDCETWSAGVEIEPTKAGVIFMPITAFLVAEDNHTVSLVTASINNSVTGVVNGFYLSLPTTMNAGVNANFYLKDVGYNIFGDDLYLFGNDFLAAGTVTLYVTYQEIIL